MGFYNSSPDKQFSLTFDFTSPEVERAPGADCTRDGKVFKVRIAPGETKPFVQGKVDGYKVTVQYGRPDVGFLMKQQAVQDRKIEELLQHRRSLDECLAQRKPYVDVDFPPKQGALCRSWEGTTTPRTWMRVADLLPDSHVGLFVAPVQPNTIRLGSLGDVYCLSVMAALAEETSLVQRIFKTSRHEQVGAYTLRLYDGGLETEVTIDSFFPFVGYCPAFVSHLTHPNELWITLLHKAHAKMRGSFIAARRGRALDALRAFTGFPLDCFSVSDTPPCDYQALFNKVRHARQRGWQCCVVTPSCAPDDTHGKKLRSRGLLGGAAYAITRAEQVDTRLLVQLRNPWLSPRLWDGRWCHTSSMWDEHPAVTESLGMRYEDDGCMWLEWEEVCGWFAQIAVLRSTPHRSATIAVELAACIPSCVIQLDVDAPCTLHTSALLSRDKRSGEWSTDNLRVAIMSRHGGVWEYTEESAVCVKRGRYFLVAFMCGGDCTSTYGRLHVTVSSEQPVGHLSCFQPSASLVQALLRADPETSLATLSPDDEDPAQPDAALECPMQLRVPQHATLNTTVHRVRL
eukprot:TRINITY_DN13138_c0_g1_i1.p1 TRINITY_DN13138_c0_g1~~TRINITY_DN13138_c0_g1_i1.p1  ORF type:complete len:656 (+),score=236.32 TRINITY_DN13138_c0_g1_i1:257-1969(+)